MGGWGNSNGFGKELKAKNEHQVQIQSNPACEVEIFEFLNLKYSYWPGIRRTDETT